MSIFANKTLMITGGTGSFGNAVLNRFLDTDIKEIRVFSRDEKKQDDMRHEFQAKLPEAAAKIKFFIGDVRDLASVKNAMHGVDYIFHAAALKQVPESVVMPFVIFSFFVALSAAPMPIHLRAFMICPALRIRLGIMRRTVVSSSAVDGARLPNR